jgi:hypothetical protein
MEFLHNAMQIEIYTRQKCKKFPKSERFTTCAALIALAREARGLLARGNEIYPTNQHEAQLRRDCFIKAKSAYADFVQEIEICCRACGINMDVLPEWMSLIDKEITLIRGVMENDRRRYKDLKP